MGELRTCPYKHHKQLICKISHCPLEDSMFLGALAFYLYASRGVRSVGFESYGKPRFAHLRKNSQKIKLVEIARCFKPRRDGRGLTPNFFSSWEWLDDIAKYFKTGRVDMNYRLCRRLRTARWEWWKRLAPAGHRIRYARKQSGNSAEKDRG